MADLTGSVLIGTGKDSKILLEVRGKLEPEKREQFKLEFIKLAEAYALRVLTFSVTSM